MNSRIFLIVDQHGAKSFDSDKIRSAISGMKGVTNWIEGKDTIHSNSLLFQCELNRNDEEVLLRVQADLMSLEIDGNTDLCCEVAIELQKKYETELFVFAEDSLPEVLSLLGVSTINEVISLLHLKG